MSTPWSTLSWYCFSIYPLTWSTFIFTRSRIPHLRGCCFLLSLFILIPFCWFCPTVASLSLQCFFIFCFLALPRTKILCKNFFAPLIEFSFLYLIFHVYSKGSKYHSFWDRYSRNESMGYRWSAEERRGGWSSCYSVMSGEFTWWSSSHSAPHPLYRISICRHDGVCWSSSFCSSRIEGSKDVSSAGSVVQKVLIKHPVHLWCVHHYRDKHFLTKKSFRSWTFCSHRCLLYHFKMFIFNLEVPLVFPKNPGWVSFLLVSQQECN